MKSIIKKALIFIAVITPFAIVGGIFTGVYTYESYSEEIRTQILQSVGSYQSFLLMTALQSLIYAAIFGFIGYILASKLSLVNRPLISKEPLIRSSIVTVICGLFFACDYFVFGSLIPQVADSYANGISLSTVLSALFYGGIIEEVLLRLFFMSLIAMIIKKLFARKYEPNGIPDWVFIAANIIAAIAFSAGHLPTTITMFGSLSPLIVFRCFLMNGALGLVFGRLYRKYGIQYAMLCHLGTHLVSKLILMLVIQ